MQHGIGRPRLAAPKGRKAVRLSSEPLRRAAPLRYASIGTKLLSASYPFPGAIWSVMTIKLPRIIPQSITGPRGGTFFTSPRRRSLPSEGSRRSFRLSQMNPDAATLAAGGPVDLDISKMEPGQQVEVRWQDHPILVTRRPAKLLQSLQDPKLIALLADPASEELQQPPYAQNWHRSANPEYGVVVGICTHLGCIPLFYPDASASQPTSNWPGGYFCPCHGSKYDLAGRVFRGVPAPYNLPVPPHHSPTPPRSGSGRTRRTPSSTSPVSNPDLSGRLWKPRRSGMARPTGSNPCFRRERAAS